MTRDGVVEVNETQQTAERISSREADSDFSQPDSAAAERVIEHLDAAHTRKANKKAVKKEQEASDTVFDFKKTEESINDSFEVNPENATQLLWGGAVYQVTSDMVSDDELGSYIDILAESVTFDTETKIPLSKEDLSKIDWYGENAGQGRECWFYTDVYEIYGTDKAEAVAVEVNNNYYIAKRQ